LKEWKETKEALAAIERRAENPVPGGEVSFFALDHAVFARALRLIMEAISGRGGE